MTELRPLISGTNCLSSYLAGIQITEFLLNQSYNLYLAASSNNLNKYLMKNHHPISLVGDCKTFLSYKEIVDYQMIMQWATECQAFVC